jgi:hypothetical protein
MTLLFLLEIYKNIGSDLYLPSILQCSVLIAMLDLVFNVCFILTDNDYFSSCDVRIVVVFIEVIDSNLAFLSMTKIVLSKCVMIVVDSDSFNQFIAVTLN